jgi:hypothetical protein
LAAIVVGDVLKNRVEEVTKPDVRRVLVRFQFGIGERRTIDLAGRKRFDRLRAAADRRERILALLQSRTGQQLTRIDLGRLTDGAHSQRLALEIGERADRTRVEHCRHVEKRGAAREHRGHAHAARVPLQDAVDIARGDIAFAAGERLNRYGRIARVLDVDVEMLFPEEAGLLRDVGEHLVKRGRKRTADQRQVIVGNRRAREDGERDDRAREDHE